MNGTSVIQNLDEFNNLAEKLKDQGQFIQKISIFLTYKYISYQFTIIYPMSNDIN